ncbi:MAG: ATP-binding protein, partial [Gemmatimonadaceae bacterium]
RMEIHVEEFLIDDLLRDTVSTAVPLASRGGNRIVLEGAGSLGTMHGDAVRTRQILLNLLSNAAKFTEGGTITVVASRGDGWLRVKVRDTGIGMTPSQQEKLFRPFTQVDDSSTRKYEGTGLGLTITKRYTEMLGGSITVSSEAGVGTTFDVRLPIGSTATQPRSTGALQVMDL